MRPGTRVDCRPTGLSDIGTVRIVAGFLAEQGIALDAADILEGVRRGFLNPRVAAAFAGEAIAGGSTDPLWAAIEFDVVSATAAHDRASASGGLQDDLRSELTHRRWLFLQLQAAYLSRAELPDPLQAVGMIYADFDYPASIESFVRYMPLQPGEVAGVEGVFDRWRRFLDSEASCRTAPEWPHAMYPARETATSEYDERPKSGAAQQIPGRHLSVRAP